MQTRRPPTSLIGLALATLLGLAGGADAVAACVRACCQDLSGCCGPGPGEACRPSGGIPGTPAGSPSGPVEAASEGCRGETEPTPPEEPGEPARRKRAEDQRRRPNPRGMLLAPLPRRDLAIEAAKAPIRGTSPAPAATPAPIYIQTQRFLN